MKVKLPKDIKELSQTLEGMGYNLYVVGGAVRDTILGVTPKDIDLMVTGFDSVKSAQCLFSSLGIETKPVVKTAPVLLCNIEGENYEIALARKELSTASDANGFQFLTGADITVLDDLFRRDVTAGAMAWHIAKQTKIDPFGGERDIELGILRHVSQAFTESNDRPFRLFNFSSRFGWELVKETAEVCLSMNTLPAIEQIWKQWEKAMFGEFIRTGIKTLIDIDRCPNELTDLVGVPQDKEWHPEGDVFQHTMFVVEAAQKIAKRDGLNHEDSLVLIMAAFCHDMGKPQCTDFIDGRWRSPKHNTAGVEPANSFMDKIGFPHKLRKRVTVLVEEHMFHIHHFGQKAVRRLSNRLAKGDETIPMLAKLVEADHSGRPPLPQGLPKKMAEVVSIAEQLGVKDESPQPMVMGRHLIKLGVQPSPAMGSILRTLFEAQLDGMFSDAETGIDFAQKKGLVPAKKEMTSSSVW